jgi:dipeptidyl aminopeptidase/acylaminoacyl peptidase
MKMTYHVERSRRMAEERWLIDKVIEATGVDFSWPMSALVLNTAPNIGPDVMSIRLRVKKYADISREFARVATKREAMGKKAEDEGHSVTASENYFAAAICYGMAQWPIHEDDNEENLAYSSKKTECYDKFIKYSGRPIERVEIPFEGKSLPGLLHLPHESSQKVPCILSIDGMDGFKEMMHPIYGDKFLERGMAVLAFEGPGQGECCIRKIRCTADNFPRAGQAAMDFLVKRPEIDSSRIGVCGTSMGSFWVTQIAACDHRFKAAAVMYVCHESGMNTIFNMASPTFKARYMWMAGYEDEDEFDRFAQTLTLKGLGAKIKCPFMIVAGGNDQLSPVEYSYDLYDEITVEKKIVVYEGELHAISYAGDVQNLVADWLKDRLEGKPTQPERIYIDTTGREVKR